MECWRMGRLTVFPVFYHVNPSDVQNQTGDFGKYFAQLKKDSKVDTVDWENWKVILNQVGDCSVDPKANEDPLETCRDALKKVGNLSGWHVQDRDESEVIEEISLMIFGGLIRKSTGPSKSLFGIEFPAKEIMDLLALELDDVRFVGICGMGGIGKTTLAKIIYQRALPKFEASCFIHRIGKSKNDHLFRLQKQLISALLPIDVANSLSTEHEAIETLESKLSTIKVLIVLDDVCRREQVQALAKSSQWFGDGSRIIITSRNHHLPPYLSKDNIYEVRELNYEASLELFCSKAFNKCSPKEKFEGLIKEFVDFAKGLPLALEVFGSYLYDEETSVWESYLVRLKANLDGDVVDTLKITFDGLEDLAKEVFLDIACFFNGESKYYVTSKLKHLGYPSESILKDLERKSLIKFVESGELHMHDLLAKIGQEIGKHDRLWRTEEIITTLREEIGIVKLKSLVLKLSVLDEEKMGASLCFEAFSKMKNLRMLQIIDVNGKPNIGLFVRPTLKWGGEPSKLKLSNKLRIMEWWKYPLESLPFGENFMPANLVELSLNYSSIKRLWDGHKCFLELKHIDLSYSKKLIEIPNLSSQVPNLEILNLSYCRSLFAVHSSVGLLKQLKELLLECCWNLEQLPNRISSKFLEVLDLSQCLKLKNFPNTLGKMRFLRRLSISKATTKEFLFSFVRLPSLEELHAHGTHEGKLRFDIDFSKERKVLTVAFYDSNTNSQLSTSFSALSSLKSLILRGCILSNEAKPIDLSDLSECSYDELKELPETLFSSLRSLSEVGLRNCNLVVIPNSISCWSLISRLDLSENRFIELPDSICELSSLKVLNLDGCIFLRGLPKLPFSLRFLKLRNCPLLEAFDSQLSTKISREMLRTSACSFTISYIGFEGKPYKILYLHPQSPPYKHWQIAQHIHFIESMVACGPLLESKIPDWFIHKSINSNKKIQILIDWSSYSGRFPPSGFALLIVYEIHGLDKRGGRNKKLDEPENSDIGSCVASDPNIGAHESSNQDIGACESSNHIFPEFVCQLRLNEVSREHTLVFRVPEVVCIGSHGVWVFINKPKTLQVLEPMKRWSYLASITASSENTELKECGARLVAASEFCQFVGSISQRSLNSKSVYHSLAMDLSVTGPIKVNELP